MGRLERHLDLDAIRRVKAGIHHKDIPMSSAPAKPRPLFTFRGARRNAKRGENWRGVVARYVPPGPTRPNRSPKWRRRSPIDRVIVEDHHG